MNSKDQNFIKELYEKRKVRVYSIVECEFGGRTVNRDDRAESDCIWALWSCIFGYFW